MALQISKSDLQWENTYSWKVKPGDNPKITGHPDSDLLNRGEGYEVLDLINHFLRIHSMENMTSAKHVEKLIKHHLPTNIRGRQEILKWLAQNWKNY